MKKLWILGLFIAAAHGQISQPVIVPTATTPTSCHSFFWALTTASPWTIYAPTAAGACQALGSGGGTTTDPLTAAASGGAAPGSTFNGSASVTFDYHSFGAAAALPNCSPETSSFNAAAVGCYSLTGSTASTGTVTATVSTGLLIKYFNSSSANLTVAASAGPTLTCLVTTSCVIPAGGSATIFTPDGTNLDAYIPSVGGSSGSGNASYLSTAEVGAAVGGNSVGPNTSGATVTILGMVNYQGGNTLAHVIYQTTTADTVTTDFYMIGIIPFGAASSSQTPICPSGPLAGNSTTVGTNGSYTLALAASCSPAAGTYLIIGCGVTSVGGSATTWKLQGNSNLYQHIPFSGSTSASLCTSSGFPGTVTLPAAGQTNTNGVAEISFVP